MPVMLAIDTSTDCASLAVLSGESRLTETAIHSTDGHSTRLFAELQALLRRAGVRLEDVDCFAAAAGPGSFTGVRVALAAVKGLAASLDKPMVAVSSLEALAWFGETPLRGALIDARRGDIYGGVFDAGLMPLRPEMVTSLDAWLEALPNAAGVGEIEILIAQPALLPVGRQLPAPVRVAPAERLACAVAHIARGRFLGGQAVDPALTDANYVRRADAEMNWVDR
jgi:tRNA threonylcarbamoyladenosine biosynthesis protein TsaB